MEKSSAQVDENGALRMDGGADTSAKESLQGSVNDTAESETPRAQGGSGLGHSAVDSEDQGTLDELDAISVTGAPLVCETIDQADSKDGGEDSNQAAQSILDDKIASTCGNGSPTAREETGGGDVGHSDVDEQERPDMIDLKQEISSIRAVLSCTLTMQDSDGDADNDLLQRIRLWGDCPWKLPQSEATTEPFVEQSSGAMLPRFIPMLPPCKDGDDNNTQTRPAEEASGEEPLPFRVICFEDGVYRGQVKPSPDPLDTPHETDPERLDLPAMRLVPHGWGMVTSHRGLRRVGRWLHGEQVGVGSLQSAVLHYDGEWHANAGPSGYGVGTFAFGATFVGCWMNGRPYGLGRMQLAESSKSEDGWFYGTRCLQPVVEKDADDSHLISLKSHLPATPHADQPQSGLFLVGEILENSRLLAMRSAMEKWRRCACDHAIELARRARAATIPAWIQAHTAEQHALAQDMAHQMQGYRDRMASILQDVSAGREKHTRVQRIREFHTNRLNTAVFQRDLARRCVESQKEVITLMQSELTEVATLLDEAKQAQVDCMAFSQQLSHVKRQIENASVKVNAVRQKPHTTKEDSIEMYQDQQDAAARLALKTPATPSHARALHGPRHSFKEADVDLPFVCDTPGCSCGIPRQVFLRVGSALNGD